MEAKVNDETVKENHRNLKLKSEKKKNSDEWRRNRRCGAGGGSSGSSI